MKNIIITAGGTSEKIDEVRKITNSGSGRLGYMITKELLKRNDDYQIYYICSKRAIKPMDDRVSIIEVEGSLELERIVKELLNTQVIDCFIHSMAVSDYMVDYVTNMNKLKESIIYGDKVEVINDSKISSNEEDLVIVLKPTPKIISMIKMISPNTYLVGFKLLNGVLVEELIEVAKDLRDRNNCDMVVANDLETIREGEHIAYLIDKEDNITECRGKDEIAKKLVKSML